MRVISENKVGLCTIKHIEVDYDVSHGTSFRGQERFDVHDKDGKRIYSSRWFQDALKHIWDTPKCTGKK